MKILNRPTLLLTGLLLPPLLSAAPNADGLPAADRVVEWINAVDEGDHVSRKLSMRMTDKRGKVRERETLSYRKFFGDEKRTVLFYQRPSNVKGTGFLTYDYRDNARDDDQWLYLPALRKVRRISASDRGDYFLGTDMTYEDMKLEGKLEPADYHYQVLAEESLDRRAVLKLEGMPRSREIARELGYGKVQFWVDRANWLIVRAEYWDTRGKPLKTLTTADIRQVDGIWTRHQLEVENHRTGHKTRFLFSEVDYRAAVRDGLFRKNALARGR